MHLVAQRVALRVVAEQAWRVSQVWVEELPEVSGEELLRFRLTSDANVAPQWIRGATHFETVERWCGRLLSGQRAKVWAIQMA